MSFSQNKVTPSGVLNRAKTLGGGKPLHSSMTAPTQNSSKTMKKKSNFDLALFDFFGGGVSLNIKQEESVKTAFGCCWTIIIGALLLYITTDFMLDYINRKNSELTVTST
jgi:hypothetical protein